MCLDIDIDIDVLLLQIELLRLTKLKPQWGHYELKLSPDTQIIIPNERALILKEKNEIMIPTYKPFYTQETK